MEDFAKCPYCDVALEFDDTLDSEYDSGQYFDTVVGHCPICEKSFRWSFRWREVYLYDRAEEVEEMENEENE